MRGSRRRLLLLLSAVIPGLFLRAGLATAQTPTPRARRPQPQPDASESNDNSAPGFPPGSGKALLEQRQKDIKKSVEKLFELASQLKTEVEKTDATVVLSLAMVKKAEEIEKLARQIKDNAKG
jgi:hypothetical protein